MKRKLLLGCCAMAAIAVSAQSIEMKSRPIKNVEKCELKIAGKAQLGKEAFMPSSPDRQFTVKELEGRSILPYAKPALRASEALEAYYKLPNEALHYGMGKDWMLSYPNIVLPPAIDVIFANLSTPDNVSSLWKLQGTTATEMFGPDGDKLFKVIGEEQSYSTNWPAWLMGGGWKLVPTLEVSGTTTSSYYYSKDATFNNQPIDANRSVQFPAGGFSELATYDPILAGGPYSGFTGADESSKKFGSGQKNSKGELCTGIVSVYRKLSSALVVEGVSIHAIPNKKGNQNAVSEDNLTLHAYKVNGGTITKEVLAEAECTSIEYDIEGGTFYITFQFVKDQGLLGTQPAPFTFDQDVAIEIDGFDKCDITALVVAKTDLNGHAYGVYPSTLDYVSYDWYMGTTGYSFNMADFALNLNAVYVTLTSDEGDEYSLTAPSTGGLATETIEGNQYTAFRMYSTFPFFIPETEDETYTQIIAPDWMKFAIDDSKFGTDTDGYSFLFQIECEALPAGTTGREGEVVFETVGGIQTKVHVIQGDGGGSGLSKNEVSPVNAYLNSDNFELSYPAEFKTVSVMNIAGQVIATYTLPASGKYAIPAAGLSRGMYLLRFNGNTVVKIIK